MKLPDYLILGSMKCGTGALYTFVATHPAVTPATVKEIHYFTLHWDKGLNWYAEHFDAGAAHTLEASPTYFDAVLDDQYPTRIRDTLPGVRLMLIVRDPVERAVSHFNHLQVVKKLGFALDTTADDFFAANPYLEMSPGDVFSAPVRDDAYARGNPHISWFETLNFGLYRRRYETYVDTFGPDRILVIEQSRLARSPRRTMNRVFEFLGLEAFESPRFGEMVYSHGSDRHRLRGSTRRRMRGFFREDYRQFLRSSRSRIA